MLAFANMNGMKVVLAKAKTEPDLFDWLHQKGIHGANWFVWKLSVERLEGRPWKGGGPKSSGRDKMKLGSALLECLRHL